MTDPSPTFDPILQAEVESLRAQLDMLRVELEETNRGVVALYAELDDQAEELRRAKQVSETRFLAVYRHAPCGIALLDADGRVVETNPAIEALLGRPSGELLARRLADFAAPGWAGAVDSVARASSGGLARQEVAMARPDGSTARLEWSATPDIGEGLTLALAVDVSQRVELEGMRAQWLDRERSARGDAERGSRMKDDFISVLAQNCAGRWAWSPAGPKFSSAEPPTACAKAWTPSSAPARRNRA